MLEYDHLIRRDALFALRFVPGICVSEEYLRFQYLIRAINRGRREVTASGHYLRIQKNQQALLLSVCVLCLGPHFGAREDGIRACCCCDTYTPALPWTSTRHVTVHIRCFGYVTHAWLMHGSRRVETYIVSIFVQPRSVRPQALCRSYLEHTRHDLHLLFRIRRISHL